MMYLPTMTEDEIRYVCSIIPKEDAVFYFKRNPKEFAKIRPGFRPEKAAKLDIGNLLFNNRNQYFISSFIEMRIGRWLEQIDEAINKKLDEGKSKESALLQTLPQCYFIDNIELYFKLTDEECSEEFLVMLSTSIKIIKKVTEERDYVKSKLDAKVSEASDLESELKRIKNEQNIMNKKLTERLDEINALKRVVVEYDKSKAAIVTLEQTIAGLKQKAQEQEECIQLLRTDLSTTKDEQLQLDQKIREELTKKQETEMSRQIVALKSKRPKDLDEFGDYLGYNFENIGVQTGADYYPLLKDYLCEILFQGKPIIISNGAGLSLIKCVSNTLANTPIVPFLTYTNEITEKHIVDFLSQNNRILCLDNFVGNYNETTLITLCDKHKDKIIFYTVVYDHTLAYVPDEMMRYCYYLNLNRIEAFSGDKELTEDPSHVDEAEAERSQIGPDIRWSVFLKEVLEELGLSGALSVYKQSLVTNEQRLCSLLAFDILPYCADVLRIFPFNVSERLDKYAGNSGRCPYKDLFLRWFS